MKLYDYNMYFLCHLFVVCFVCWSDSFLCMSDIENHREIFFLNRFDLKYWSVIEVFYPLVIFVCISAYFFRIWRDVHRCKSKKKETLKTRNKSNCKPSHHKRKTSTTSHTCYRFSQFISHYRVYNLNSWTFLSSSQWKHKVWHFKNDI